MRSQGTESRDGSRRNFLKTIGTLSSAAMAGMPRPAEAEQQTLPQIRIGKYSISRLICGSNPFGALSHLSGMINYEFRQYYTPQQVVKTLRRCQDVGINTCQFGELSNRFIDEGLKMQFLASARGDTSRIKQFIELGCIGVGHHGVETDKLFKLGQLEKVRDYCKRVRDSGVLVGVVTHMPTVVDTIESQGWDVDYYMTCVYQWGRTKAELEKLFPPELLPVEATLPFPEVFLQSEPQRMYRVIRQTKKPCLAYKILAAGRRCERPEMVAQAFREAFENIKSTDAVIVGIYDRYADQAAQNAEHVRRFSSLSSTAR